MTEFGKWLGKENGKTMLSEIFRSDCTKEQARCAIITYCTIFGIEVDTKEWDDLMKWVWSYYNSWFSDYETMDMYMCHCLV